MGCRIGDCAIRATAEPSWHRTLRKKRKRARAVLRHFKNTCIGDPARIEAARQLLIEHHGTRGTAKLAMGGDGFTTIGRGGKKQKTHARDWKCVPCSAGKEESKWHFVFKNKDKRNHCSKAHTKSATIYENTKLGEN